MSGILQQGLQELIRNGAVEFLVFMIVFTLVYGVLETIHLFSKKDDSKSKKKARRVHALIAISLGLLTLVPRYTGNTQYDVVSIIERSLPQVSLVIVALIGALLLLGLLNIRFTKDQDNPLKKFIAFIAFGVVVWIFVGASDWYWRMPHWMNSELAAILIAILVFGLVVSFVLGKDKTGYYSDAEFRKVFNDPKKKIDWSKATNAQKAYDLLTKRK